MFDPDENDLNMLEERLRSWMPSAGGLDRDRLLFETGRARASARLWKLATAAAILLSFGLGTGWLHERAQRRDVEPALSRPSPPVVSHPPVPEVVAERPEPVTPVDPLSYLGLIRQVKNMDDAADFGPHRIAPHRASKVHSADLPTTQPLRPHDFDRVISL